MNKITKARKYNSSKLQELLDEVSPLEMEQTKTKMKLAARIEDYMRAKGWNKSQFAEKVGKNPSEITKWLSGTQNFTVDVLTEIASTFDIELTALFGKHPIPVVYRKEIVVNNTHPNIPSFNSFIVSVFPSGRYVETTISIEVIETRSKNWLFLPRYKINVGRLREGFVLFHHEFHIPKSKNGVLFLGFSAKNL